MTARDIDPEVARQRMVDEQICGRGVRDPAVIAALRTVPRERFVDDRDVRDAHDDTPLRIGHDQTISQPFVVAWMAEAAEIDGSSRVLEIGTGSGYGAAVLGRIAAEVWSIERIDVLADSARRRLGALGYDNVSVVNGDGTLGLAERAPFDAIVVTAAGPRVPPALTEQLADGGRLIIPIESGAGGQDLVRVRRRDDDFEEEALGGVRFVPLIGEQGWTGR